MFRRFLTKIMGPDIAREALEAYYSRLPESISVSWQKEDGFIVGEILTDDQSYITQGRDGDEFVAMVNDAVYTAYNIPESYRKYVRTYTPRVEELVKLGSNQVLHSKMRLKKVTA